VSAGSRLPAGQAWITPSGYQRERRGARDTAVRDFHFGRSALLQARRRLLDIGEKQRANRQALIEVTDPLVAVQSLLAGVDAARELAAREPEFELARQQVDELRGELQAIEQRRETAAQDYDAMIERTKSLASALATAAQKQKAAHDRHRSVEHEYLTAKRAQIDHILAWRSLRANKPPAWRSPAALAEARFRYASSAGVEHEIRRLEELRKINTYVTDEHCEPRRDKLKADHAAMEGRIGAQHANLDRARGSTERARGAYVNKLKATLRQYARNLQQLGALAGIAVEVEHPQISNDDLSLAQASLGVQFNFDQKGLIGLNDGEASGGQQVMKSMILLIGLMMEDVGGGFVFIDEPFAHLDIFNIDKVGAFLQATKAQYIVTTPNTHNVNVFKPSDLALVTQKRRPGGGWAPPVAFLRRDRGAAR
jgi:chromosome segregation ATPase